MQDLWTLDFETEAIDGHIPPVPVGLAVRDPGGKSIYYSWGHSDSPHPGDLELAKGLYFNLCAAKTPMLFHNGKFDIGVASYHWGTAPRDYLTVHDTMFLLFLNNPYSKNLALKPSSEELLDWPAEEQDELHNWILRNVPGSTPKTAGAYIARAPHAKVEKYAIGDVDRTFALFQHLYPLAVAAGHEGAYKREQQLMPILYESEQRGVRVDRERLALDLEEIYEPSLLRVEEDLRTRLSCTDLDFGKKARLADALESAGFIGEWVLTPTGKRSTAKDNLEKAVNDEHILHLLRYRGAMAGVLQTFARPWVQDSASDGRLHTSWNQVRTRGAHDTGTRTGRLSASRPNLMNVANELKIVLPEGYTPPPLMRKYLLPEEGHVWLKRDFSSQEVRILAHFEGERLMDLYNEDPNLDPHQMATDEIEAILGVPYPRSTVKRIVFGIIYGQGSPSLASELKITTNESESIRDALFQIFPAIRKLQKGVKSRADRGGFVTTWGKRTYYAEPATLLGGRVMNFSYKVLNYLIQGSAADQTKECIIRWSSSKLPGDTFMASVHDEINISAPKDHANASMKALRDCMDADLFDVPMRSEGFVGANWFNLKECA